MESAPQQVESSATATRQPAESARTNAAAAQLLLRRAITLHELFDYAGAIRDFEAVLRLDPGNAEARRRLELARSQHAAEVSLGSGRAAGDANELVRRAEALYNSPTPDYPAALKLLNEALSLQPGHRRAQELRRLVSEADQAERRVLGEK